MKKVVKWVTYAFGVFWAMATFLASNSPSDIQDRTDGWLTLPFFRNLPDIAATLAGNSIVFAITFLFAGVVVGWNANSWWSNRGSRSNWWSDLGTEMSLLNYSIADCGPYTDMHRLNAEIDVIRVKAETRGLEFPKFRDGFTNVGDLQPYLARVAAHLKAGNVAIARDAASQLATKPPAA